MNIPMNLESALKRLKWKVSKSKDVEDIEAFNSVLAWFDLFEKNTLKTNPVATKLFLDKFMMLTRASGNNHDSVTAISIIQDIVKMPLEEHYKIIQRESSMVKFELLYEDFDSKVRRAFEVAKANMIPAKDSETLRDEYRKEDVLSVANAKQERARNKMKMVNTATTVNPIEHIKYFGQTQLKYLYPMSHD